MIRINKAWLASFIGAVALSPGMALAYDLTFDPGGILAGKTKLGAQDPAYIVFTLVNTSLIFLGSITLILMIAAGFMWLLAAGEEEKITKAKDILKGAIFGLVIVLASYGLSQYIFTALQVAITGKTA